MNRQETRVKICGFSDEESIGRAIELGVDYIGIVVDFPKVFQSVSDDEAVNLILKVREQNPEIANKLVGVFVDKPIENLQSFIVKSELLTVQLHGSESVDYCRQIRSLGVSVIKAFRVQDAGEEKLLLQIEPYIGSIDKILLDAYSPDRKGGSFGITFGWELAELVNKTFSNTSLVLAGGLNTSNVFEAINKVNPFAIDVSSSMDESPGVKDLEKVEEFINLLRSNYE